MGQTSKCKSNDINDKTKETARNMRSIYDYDNFENNTLLEQGKTKKLFRFKSQKKTYKTL